MNDVTVITTEADYGEVKRILDSVADGADGRSADDTPEKVFVICNAAFGWKSPKDSAMYTVIDNRDHMAFTEDFSTLDGAMAYACDLRTTCDGQSDWDRSGQFSRLVFRKPGLEASEIEELARWVRRVTFFDEDDNGIAQICLRFSIRDSGTQMVDLWQRMTHADAKTLACRFIDAVAEPCDGYADDFDDASSGFAVSKSYLEMSNSIEISATFRT